MEMQCTDRAAGKDLKGLLPEYNKGAKRIIKEKEIYSAMKMYNPKAMLTQRARLEDWQGWEYKPIKRNGRKRAEHIRLMNFIRDEISGKEIRGAKVTAGKQKKKQFIFGALTIRMVLKLIA